MVNKVKFDRDEVVQKACTLFWQKGFHATSTRDLQQAVDLRPGSIYATFGSKEGLFIEALQCYADSMVTILNQCLNDNNSVLQGLENFVRKIIIEDRQQLPSNVCMLVKANAEFTTEDPSLLALSQALLSDFEKHLSSLFEQAQKQGELPSKLKPLDYARNFQIQFTGLRSYLNRSSNETLANTLIKQSFQLLKQM